MKVQGYSICFEEKEVTNRNMMASKNNTQKSPRTPKPSQQPHKLETKHPVEPSNRDQRLTVVGIGKSAGISNLFNILTTENNDWHLMCLRSNRTTDDKIRGVVVSFMVINKLKQAEMVIHVPARQVKL